MLLSMWAQGSPVAKARKRGEVSRCEFFVIVSHTTTYPKT